MSRAHGHVLPVLCVTEVTSWGILYYAFPVLSARLCADTGWSRTAVTTAFSFGLVVSAVAGIGVGRWIDHYGPRWVMSAGSLLGVIGVGVVASSSSLVVFFLGWVIAGLGMAGTLYPPAFAALTRWYGPDRLGALTVLTLAAGLASTVFAPVTAALVGQFSWRQTYLVLAVALAVITLPAHVYGLRQPWPAVVPEPVQGALEAHDPHVVARSVPFLLLAAGMTLAGFSFYAVVINLVPLLEERGLSTPAAALALGLGGAGQVAGRLGYSRLVAHVGVRTRAVVVLLAGALTASLLGVLSGPVVLVIAVAILAGAARGVFTLVQATTVSDRWGTHHYGRLSGLLAAPMTTASAVAPAAGAALADLTGGYPAAFQILAGLALAAALLIATT